MRYPLSNWNTTRKGYRFGSKTFYSSFHLGVDHITRAGTKIYAPTNGYVKTLYGKQGGNTIHFTNERLIRFMHLSKFGKKGRVKEGDVIGYVGNTGLSTGSHLHTDVSKKKSLNLSKPHRLYFSNPETYFKKGVEMTYKEKLKKANVRIQKLYKRISDRDKALKTAKELHITFRVALKASGQLVSDLKAKLVQCKDVCKKVAKKSNITVVVEYILSLFKK